MLLSSLPASFFMIFILFLVIIVFIGCMTHRHAIGMQFQSVEFMRVCFESGARTVVDLAGICLPFGH